MNILMKILTFIFSLILASFCSFAMEPPAKKRKIDEVSEELSSPPVQPHFNPLVLTNWSEYSCHFDPDTARTKFKVFTDGKLVETLEAPNTASSSLHHLFLSKDKVYNLLSIDHNRYKGYAFTFLRDTENKFLPHPDYKNEDDPEIYYSSPVLNPQTEDLWVIENPKDSTQNSRLVNLKKGSSVTFELGQNFVAWNTENEILLPQFVLLPNGGFHIFYHADEFGSFILRNGIKEEELVFNAENEPHESDDENIPGNQMAAQPEEQTTTQFDIDLNILSGDNGRYYLTAIYREPFCTARLILFENGNKKVEKVFQINTELISGGEQPIATVFEGNLFMNSVVIRGDKDTNDYQNTDVLLWNGIYEKFNRLKIMNEFNWMIDRFNQRNGNLYVVYKYVGENAPEDNPTFRLDPEKLKLGAQEEYSEEKHSHCQKLGGNYGLSDFISEECKILSSDYYEHTRPHVEHLLGSLRKAPDFIFSKGDSDAIYIQLLNLVNLARIDQDFPSDLVEEFISDLIDHDEKHPFHPYALALKFEAEIGREELYQEKSGYKPIDVTEETSNEDFHRKLQPSIEALTRMDEFLPHLPKNSSVTEDYQTLYDAVNAAVTKLKASMSL